MPRAHCASVGTMLNEDDMEGSDPICRMQTMYMDLTLFLIFLQAHRKPGAGFCFAEHTVVIQPNWKFSHLPPMWPLLTKFWVEVFHVRTPMALEN